MFQKYQHIERFGSSEVEQIEIGECYIFPKIDGTNASVWIYNGEIQAGSRTRHLSLDKDNAGFLEWVLSQDNIANYLKENPTHRLYGEWLVPHSLNTYRQNAWRKFYVFDVAVDKSEDEILHDGDTKVKYLHYNDYKYMLDKHSIDYIPPIAIIKNPSYEGFINQLNTNTFLIEDGKGVGEGIVIKNYDFRNRFNRQTWAKIVTSEFKEKHAKVMGASEIKGNKMIEEDIVEKYITTAFCEKELSKIVSQNDNTWSSKMIPQLLNTIFYQLVIEESWNFIKEFKYPTINFKTLQHFTFLKVKKCLPNTF